MTRMVAESMVYRFLIVDDTQFMRKMAADSLKQYDYEVAGEAVNGKEAIAKYKELKPDIVLMDLTMPEMNGVEAIRKIMNDEPDAIILVCSSSNQKDMIKEAMDAGAKGYLTKPFDSSKMEEIIRKHAIPHLKKAQAVYEPIGAAALRQSEADEAAEEARIKSGRGTEALQSESEAVLASAAVTVDAAPENTGDAAVIRHTDTGKAEPEDDLRDAVKPYGADSVHFNPPEQTRHALSNFVMSYMCSWEENLEGTSSNYKVTCTSQANKLVVEWTDGNHEKQSIPFSMEGFQQLVGWLNQQVQVQK